MFPTYALQGLAESISEEEFDDRLKELRSSEIWETNERLRTYIERQWLPKYQVSLLNFTSGYLKFVFIPPY